MSNWIIGTPEFMKHLDSWLFKSDQPSAEFLHRNKSRVPPMFHSYSQKLYRGMVVDLEVLDLINTKGLTFKNHSSWSKDIRIAKKFATDPQYMMGSSKKDGSVIILEKTIPASSQILDIDAFVMFMGAPQLMMMGYDETNLDSAMKEKEVLISKGIKVTKKDVMK